MPSPHKGIIKVEMCKKFKMNEFLDPQYPGKRSNERPNAVGQVFGHVWSQVCLRKGIAPQLSLKELKRKKVEPQPSFLVINRLKVR